MGLMDSVKQVMKGRSTTIERGVDTALGHVGRLSDSLRRHATTVKARARSLDSTATDVGDPAGSSSAAPGGPTPGEAVPGTPPSPAGPSLRGDLVEPPPDGDARPGSPST